MYAPTHPELLEEYATKPVRRVIQVDGFVNQASWDDVMQADADGDTVLSGARYELRNLALASGDGGLAVRVTISDGAKAADVRRLLSKMLGVLDGAVDVGREDDGTLGIPIARWDTSRGEASLP